MLTFAKQLDPASLDLYIDGDPLIYQCLHSATEVANFGDGDVASVFDLDEAKDRAFRIIDTIIDIFGVKEAALALSSKTNFRKGLYPQYKSNRPGEKPEGFAELREVIVEMGAVEIEHLEADDVLGIWATTPRGRKRRALIVSVDKDMHTIPGVYIFNPNTLNSNGPVQAPHYNSPDAARAYHLFQTLTGDSTDGYPGCPGIGKVKAAALLAPFSNSDGGIPEGAAHDAWRAVVTAYNSKGLEAADALTQARLAKVLTDQLYNRKTNEITLWTPSQP